VLDAAPFPSEGARVRDKDVLGRRGEDEAFRHLNDHGYTVIDRNWRCPEGEVDLVAIDGDDLVFVEVKTRTSTRFGTPLEAIGARKFTRMQLVAFAWCSAHRASSARVRFDVVEVIAPPSGGSSITVRRGVC
jgi:putative endonuclease